MKISIGILSYNAPITLENTLSNYVSSGFISICTNREYDIFAVLQMSPLQNEEELVCTKYGIRFISLPDNGMMGSGFKAIYDNSLNDYILYLENDFLIDSSINIAEFIDSAMYFIIHMNVHVIRCRSRNNPGKPTFSDELKKLNRKHSAWTILLADCAHFIKNPDIEFPNKIKLINNPIISEEYKNEHKWYLTSARYCNYTNNPCLTSKSFFKENILPYCRHGSNIEGELIDIWARKDYTCIFGPGLFTHYRIDGHKTFTKYLCLKNKSYTWGPDYITFLYNGKMNAFGTGEYEYIESNVIKAFFGDKLHIITFTEDGKEFTSIRSVDGEKITGYLTL